MMKRRTRRRALSFLLCLALLLGLLPGAALAGSDPTYELTLQLTARDGTPLAGAEFALDPDASSGTANDKTNDQGMLTFSGLTAGSYDIWQIDTAFAYDKTTSIYHVTIANGGKITYTIDSDNAVYNWPEKGLVIVNEKQATREITLPISKGVVINGNVEPGQSEFTFELCLPTNVQQEGAVLPDLMAIDTDTITASGKEETTQHQLSFTVPESLFDNGKLQNILNTERG